MVHMIIVHVEFCSVRLDIGWVTKFIYCLISSEVNFTVQINFVFVDKIG